MTTLILQMLLALLLLHGLAKPVVFFLVRYDTRRRMLDKQYGRKASATGVTDQVLLGIVLVLLMLLFTTRRVEYLSFGVGLYCGMTLIQLYFHRFSKPLSPDRAPAPPVSPIKMMSYAIQANPERPWKELLVITVLLLWVVGRLAVDLAAHFTG